MRRVRAPGSKLSPWEPASNDVDHASDKEHRQTPEDEGGLLFKRWPLAKMTVEEEG